MLNLNNNLGGREISCRQALNRGMGGRGGRRVGGRADVREERIRDAVQPPPLSQLHMPSSVLNSPSTCHDRAHLVREATHPEASGIYSGALLSLGGLLALSYS